MRKALNIKATLQKPVNIAPLVVFRILFGSLMLFSTLRFLFNGWVKDFYIDKTYTFTWYGFDWIQPLPGNGMYFLFFMMIIACLLIITGLFYRTATILFFLTFSYVELIDKTYYLNHYYFISLVSFMMIWLPASSRFSLDVKWRNFPKTNKVAAWTIYILMFQIGVVYFFAGIAKINYDWLMEAMPLKVWFKAFTWWPYVGELMGKEWLAYFFSWAGMLYDVSIVFFLLNKNTRPFAYIAVIFFHVVTWVMFPIGVFPWVMISLTLIFFSNTFHDKVLSFLGDNNNQKFSPQFLPKYNYKIVTIALVIWCIIQLALPFRYLLYDGKLFWKEEGYRFSWRVMLMEKTGMCTFFIKETPESPPVVIDNMKYLSPLQERMMSTQPDMILQFAHFLDYEFRKYGMKDPLVFADCIVSLQGNRSKPFIDKNIDLSTQKRGLKPANFILSYEQ